MQVVSRAAMVAAFLSGTVAVAHAGAVPERGAAASTLENPYSPQANGHDYRHGAIPTLDVQQLMRQWERQHLGVSVVPAASGNTLAYGGGSNASQGNVGVLSGQAKVYVVFYGNQWGTQSSDSNGNLTFSGDPYGAAPVAQMMFKGIGTGNELWSAELTQWCDGAGVSTGATSCPASGANYIPYQQNIFAGAWYDDSAASPSNATGAQLAQEAIKAAQHFGNTTSASNRYAYYVILSPHGTNPDGYQNQYCAWHDWTGDFGVNSPVGDLAFSNQPYNVDVNNCGKNFINAGSAGNLDGFTMTLGHEWHEMMSDQFPSGGWTNPSNHQENSDECAWIKPGQPGGAAMVTMGNGSYAEQASWSNDTNSCAISHSIVDHSGGGTGGTPAANFTFTTSGLSANFTDSSTDSGGSISAHSWNFGDSATSTQTNPSHTYAAAGTYNVSETVTDSVSGKTNTKTQAVTVSSASGGTPTANFSFVTNGLTAMFTDSSTDNGGTIGTHAWNFGDNQTSSATNPSHTYAAAGTYNVTETVTDSADGKTNSKTSAVTVTAPTGKTFSNNTPYALTDWGFVLSPIAASGVSGNAPATLKVNVNITHNWSGDLELLLYTPSGSSIVLRNPDFKNDGNIVATYTVNASGSLANGTWQLGVLDEDLYGHADHGTLNSWSLQF